MKRIGLILLLIVMTAFSAAALTGCGGSGGSTDDEAGGANAAGLEDGTYVVDFTTDHAMFHVNDYNNDKGILTVKDGEMTVHVSLQSKKIVNLFYGNKEDAQKEGAEMLPRTVDTIDYGD